MSLSNVQKLNALFNSAFKKAIGRYPERNERLAVISDILHYKEAVGTTKDLDPRDVQDFLERYAERPGSIEPNRMLIAEIRKRVRVERDEPEMSYLQAWIRSVEHAHREEHDNVPLSECTYDRCRVAARLRGGG